MNFIEKTVDLINELHDLTERNNFHIRVGVHGEKEVHILDGNVFFEHFNQFGVNKRLSSECPYEAVVELDGVTFYTLLTQVEHKKYVLKNGIKKLQGQNALAAAETLASLQ